jgi:hypothetical protein
MGACAPPPRSDDGGMSVYEIRWLPYLGDAVAVRGGDITLTGTATTYDASLVDVQGAGFARGQSLETAWLVGGDTHRCLGTVEAVSATGFSVRLAAAPVQASRREHERTNLSVPLAVLASQEGSFGGRRFTGQSLDLSDSGLRALIDSAFTFEVGETLQVDIDLGPRVEHVLATVMWQQEHGTGERIAGLRFCNTQHTESWAALQRVS